MPYYGTEHMAKSSGTLAPTVSMQAVCVGFVRLEGQPGSYFCQINV